MQTMRKILLVVPIRRRVQRGTSAKVNVNTPTLEAVEWAYIVRMLKDHRGNVTHAAAALGLLRQTLQRKIRRRKSSRQR